MGNDTEEKLDNEVHCLEKINEIIDLCIDSQQFDYVNEIIQKNSAHKEASKLLTSLKNKNEVEKKIKGPNGKRVFIEFCDECKYPILHVSIPADFKDYFHKFKFNGEGIFFEGDGSNELMQTWSRLLLAKRIRLELQRQNRRPWLNLYEDLTLYLEKHVPVLSSDKSNEAWKKTLFNYLMELSAVTRGEASLGYAERARNLIQDISDVSKEERYNHGTPYDRWIWYNFGLAYKHMGRHQEALIHFNLVLSKFWKAVNSRDVSNISNSLEFLLNIYPSIMRCAELNLQLQLGYHALQTLDDSKAREWLNHIRSNGEFFKTVVENWDNRTKLLIIDALLTLGGHEEDCEKRWFKNLYSSTSQIFKNIDWETVKSKLPEAPQEPPTFIQIGLIEQTVSWYLEKASNLLQKLEELSKKRDDVKLIEEIKGEVKSLIDRIDGFSNRYWHWVDGNEFDERIYFSKWAKFLGISAKILEKAHKKKIEFTENLMRSIIQLYNKNRRHLPRRRNDRIINENKIELENLQLDDLPDIVQGLNDFYEVLIKIRNDSSLSSEFATAIKDNLSTEYDDPFEQLREDHSIMLDALDEYEEEFGSNQRIKALIRCHKRIQWLTKGDCRETCDKCLDGSASILDKKAFRGILECNVMKGVGKKEEKDLNNDDYESIMTFAETGFTRSLHSRSIHLPVNTLHFTGLQRWNSLTPAQGKSVGGGYFIYHTDRAGVIDLGIVIDPGFDFVRNFFRNGFSIRDIDIVLISHAHADHLWDFESIIQLLHELNSKDKIKHRVNVIFTLGIYRRYEQHVIRNPKLREYIDPFVIDIRKEIDPEFFKKIGKVKSEKDYKIKYCFKFITNTYSKQHPEEPSISLRRWTPALPEFTDLKPQNNTLKGKNNNNGRTDIEEIEVWPTCSYHEDYSDISDSFGFKIIMKYRANNKVVLGYTGDTKWVGDDLYNIDCPNKGGIYKKNCTLKTSTPCWESVANQYEDCDVLLMHLGSLINRKDYEKKRFNYYKDSSKCEELIRKENHPYLMGMIRFLRTLYVNGKKKYKLILIGEFGEELRGGIRIDITKRLNNGITQDWKIIPVDVGLDVVLLRYNKDHKKQPIIGREFICSLCDQTILLDNIEYRRFGHDEAIFYICKTCDKAFPEDVRQDMFRKLYEIGRELKADNMQKNVETADKNGIYS